ncbi:MAG: hypothetical protein VYD59_04985 [Bacteroidota bacterium]|nr:hypothetical protein [Bacteroidota bacterium]
MKVFYRINDVKKIWSNNISLFLDINFLKIYFKNHQNITHIFCIDKDIKLYAHIFKIRFNKTHNYLNTQSLNNFFLKFFNLKVLYLTNSFLTNVPSFEFNKKNVSLDFLISKIKFNYSMIVIPDFMFYNLKIKEHDFIKLNVEDEMILKVKKEWNSIFDYKADLKTKYRSKVNKIYSKTKNVRIRQLDSNEIASHSLTMQSLFMQVVGSSNFQGPLFNVQSFVDFAKQDYMKVFGYFIDDQMVGFSSEIFDNEKMYSYYVGFDKKMNKLIPIYGRILLENISNAIKYKKETLLLGRTANEFKSNFGAVPKKSHVYLKINNYFIRLFLKPIYNNIRIKKWTQRNPFK